jgi:AmmeMemoRadiSam system protein A
MSSQDKNNQTAAKEKRADVNHYDAIGEQLLHLARMTMSRHLHDEAIPRQQAKKHNPTKGSGVFVTLWGHSSTAKNQAKPDYSKLRGCIGRLQTSLTLQQAVQEAAIGAATRDPRFVPITLEELEAIRIEIAILSQLKIVDDLQQIVIGKHGLLIEGSNRRGLLLPKVASRLNWDQRAFIDGVCTKAGLAPGCWPGTSTLFSFTTIVFDERNTYDG